MLGNKEWVCAAAWLAALQPHSHLHGNAGKGNGERPHDLQLQKWKRPKLERTNWTLSPSFPPTNSNSPSQAHTFYLHASLPSRAVWSHTPSQDPDFYTVRSLCPAITPLPPNPLCWWKVDGVRSVQRRKGKECFPALFGNVVFSFPAVSDQPTTSASLSLRTNSSYWLFCSIRWAAHAFVLHHTHSVWQLFSLGSSRIKGAM